MAESRVGILMGSDSDLAVMRQAADVLAEFGVPCELRILSAHRSPERVARYAREAASRDIKVIIAGAGLAAHLAGTVAAHTTLPVIGVPLAGSQATLGGLDALLSTVQMPPGVPVATVGVNGARNAAYLALRILALGDLALGERLSAFRERLDREASQKDAQLAALGADVSGAVNA